MHTIYSGFGCFAFQNNGVPSPFCQESLGLAHGVITSSVASLSTSEGVADDVMLHSPSMWTVSANSSDAWIKVRKPFSLA